MLWVLVRHFYVYFKMVLCSFVFSRVVVLANRIKSWDDKPELPILECYECTFCVTMCVDGMFCHGNGSSEAG